MTTTRLHWIIASQFAARAYDGVIDENGWPLHHYALTVARSFDDEDYKARIVAILHKAFQKTTHSIADLAIYQFELDVIEALRAITRHEGEDDQSYLARVRLNPLARRVKLKAYELRLHDAWIKKLEESRAAKLKNKYTLALIFLK